MIVFFKTIHKTKIFILILGLTILITKLEARYLNQYVSPPLPRYQITDLGPTTLSERVLSHGCWPISLGPKLNNKGQVIGNRGSSGFVWESCKGFTEYNKWGIFTNFIDINNKGVILGRAYDNNETFEWFTWLENQCQREEIPSFLDFKCLDSDTLFFRAINDSGCLVGSRYLGYNQYRSVFFDSRKNLKELKIGILLDVNDEDNIVGVEICNAKEQPFLWHLSGGMSVISDDLRMGKPSGIQRFGYPVLAYDSTVYGTFRGRKNGIPYIFAYQWNDKDQIFRSLDLSNMEISAVNRCHILVGRQGDNAVISMHHRSPRTLISLVKGKVRGWKLIEATDINDMGQIVGYGRLNGKLHLFLLDPILQN